MVNGKIYIGSSVNLGLRLSNYLSVFYLTNRVSIYNSKIYNALLAYGYENFRLEILEYCDRSIVIQRELYFINMFLPEYNILTKPGSSLGFKHSKDTLLKFKLRKLTPEALENLKRAKAGTKFSPLAIANQLLSTSYPIIVKDIETSNLFKYNSIRCAAREFKISHATLLNYLDKDKLFKGKYIIKKKYL